MEAALADLLEDKNLLRNGNRMFVDRHIRFAGIAGQQELTCVRGNHAFFSDPDVVCDLASVTLLDVATLDVYVDLRVIATCKVGSGTEAHPSWLTPTR